MSTPKVADTKPVLMELEPGTYYYCTCGESSNQPFCDGAHSSTEFTPQEFKITEKRKYAFCACKKTGKDPFCDGAHKTLKAS